MRVASILVTNAGHFIRGPSGRVYADGTPMDYAFWTRYLNVFDRVGVAARVREVSEEPLNLSRADGEGVQFEALPDYFGPWQHMRHRLTLGRAVHSATTRYDVACFRVPCFIGVLASGYVSRVGRPYGLEVVGDPNQSLSPGTVRSIVRPVARKLAVRSLKTLCSRACAVSYVTEYLLQRHYPPGKGTYSAAISDIDLNEECFVSGPRLHFSSPRKLILVGSLEVRYKGLDLLIMAMARSNHKDLHLTVVGDGRERPGLEALARSVGVSERISFLGRIPAGAPVRRALDEADLFVMPSRAEGLPRAMLEAMARGLPCIASNVGGIPELLDDECLVPVDDITSLTDSLDALVCNEDRLKEHSKRNLSVARRYTAARLEPLRKQFYQELLRRSCA